MIAVGPCITSDGPPFFESCQICGCYKPFQNMTEECCWVRHQKRCQFVEPESALEETEFRMQSGKVTELIEVEKTAAARYKAGLGDAQGAATASWSR